MSDLKNGFANYFAKNKVAVIFLIVCILVIFLSSFIASAIQSNGWSIEVTDLRDAENEGNGEAGQQEAAADPPTEDKT